MRAVCLIHDQRNLMCMYDLRDRRNVGHHTVIGRRCQQNRLRIRILLQHPLHLLRSNAALNTKLRLLWIQIFCLQFHQIYRMVHRFVTISRHQKPSAFFYRSTNCRKQSRGTSVDQKKTFIRSKGLRCPLLCFQIGRAHV